MPSPRKRRMKRALGNVLSTQAMTDIQRAEVKRRLNLDNTGAQLLRSIVESHSHSPRYGGNTHKGRNFLDGNTRRRTVVNNGVISTEAVTVVENGLIANLSVMDLNATAALIWVGALAAGDLLRLTDAAGRQIDVVFAVPDPIIGAGPAAALVHGDEIFLDQAAAQNAANQMTPRRFLIASDIAFNDPDEIYDELVDIVNAATAAGALDIEATHVVVNAANDGVVHLVQNTTGPAGNTVIGWAGTVGGTLRAAWPGAAAQGVVVVPQVFCGGARAQDATCFYGELHNATVANPEACLAAQGLMFYSSSNALGLNHDFDFGGLSGVPIAMIVVCGQDDLNVGEELHVKAICENISDGNADVNTSLGAGTSIEFGVQADVSNPAAALMVAQLNEPTIRKANVDDTPVQKVLGGESFLTATIVTAQPPGFDPPGAPPQDNSDAGRATQVATCGGGILLHWFYANPNPN